MHPQQSCHYSAASLSSVVHLLRSVTHNIYVISWLTAILLCGAGGSCSTWKYIIHPDLIYLFHLALLPYIESSTQPFSPGLQTINKTSGGSKGWLIFLLWIDAVVTQDVCWQCFGWIQHLIACIHHAIINQLNSTTMTFFVHHHTRG